MNSLQNALTPEELDELDSALAHPDVVEKSMDASMLHGYLTALLVGPKAIDQAAWLPWVWDAEAGKDEPKSATPAEREHALQLITRMHAELAQVFASDPDLFEPLWETWENASVDNWCRGFLVGIGLHEDDWDALLAEHSDWLAPCMELADEEEENEALDKMSEDELDAYYGDLFDQARASVLEIHGYWTARRAGQ